MAADKLSNLFHSLLLLRLATVDSKLIEGVLQTNENWAFLSRFCFVKKGGRYEYKFEYPSQYKVQNLLVYHDANEKWKAAYKTNKSCYEKEADLNPSQIVNLTKSKFDRNNHGCREVSKIRINSTLINSTVECNASWTFTGARERWWYMAISNCNSKKGLYLKYKIIMRNGNIGDHWFGHFSADEFYGLRERGLLHTTYKLYLASIISQTIGLMFLFIAYNQYAIDGQGLPPLKTTGQIFQVINSLLFIYLILLLGKGYTVTRARLSPKSNSRLILFMCSYSICYVILIVFEMAVFDPAEVLYLYESPGGYGLLILRVIGWIMLLFAVGFTIKHHPLKLPFYVPFLLFYSLWFISTPILIIIITYVIDNWVRETVSVGLDLSIAFIGHLFFLHLTWPTSANKNFPFHIKTTQVRALERFGNVSGMSDPLSLDNFSRHPYEAPAIKTNQRINELLISQQMDLTEFAPNFGSRPQSLSRNVTFHGLQSPLAPVSILPPIATVKTH
uniref:Uncharacterized protein n=1 Tax=Strigamia maritima TaxID=126957 RepID=T1JAQ3_STRMM